MLRALLVKLNLLPEHEVSDEPVPVVEFTVDKDWEEVYALEEEAVLIVSGSGKVYRIVNERWVLDRDIKDIRINS